MQLKDWSYSRYSTWKKCPALLNFQLRFPMTRQPSIAMERGSHLHKVIELYLTGEVNTLDDDILYYQDYLEKLRGASARPEVPIALTADWKPTEWDAENRWWRGILDCVIDTPEESIIIDWKTGNEYADHRDQREVYAIAYHSVNPTKFVRVIHTYLDKKQNTFTLFHEDDIPALKEDWENKIEEMLNDKAFVPNPGFYCRSCPYSRANEGPCRF